MQYKSISADGHVNEPPTLWVENLPGEVQGPRPARHRDPEDQGPRLDHGGPEAAVGHGLLLDVLPVVEAVRPGVAGRGLQADQGPRRPLRGPVPRLVRPRRRASRRSSRTRPTPRSSSTASAPCGTASSCAPTRSSRSPATRSTTTGSPSSRPTRPSASSATARCRPPASTTAIAELHRCAELGLRTVQLESYPSGSFSEPVARGRPVLGGGGRARACRSTSTRSSSSPPATSARRSPPRVCADRERGPRSSASTSQAGSFPVILWRMIAVGRLRALPRPEVRRHRGAHRLGALLPRALRRLGAAQPTRVEPAAAARASTSAATCRVVYIVDEVGAHNRYDIGVANIMWGPDFPHSSSGWPVDYELGREILERAGCTRERDRADHVEERGRHLQGALRRAGHHRRRRVSDGRPDAVEPDRSRHT